MGSNYSTKLVSTAIEFLRVAGHELGTEFGQEKVNAMLDAFDPELKAQVFMHLLVGEYSYALRIQTKPSVYYQNKIEAIKAIRSVTGFGLKESKDITDAADAGQPIAVNGQWTSEQRRKLAAGLVGTGYEVV